MLRFETLIDEASTEPAPIATVDPDDTKVVLYTSGTTGNPKPFGTAITPLPKHSIMVSWHGD